MKSIRRDDMIAVSLMTCGRRIRFVTKWRIIWIMKCSILSKESGQTVWKSIERIKSFIMDKNNSPLVFFDSGIGGLTVLKEAMKVLPHEDFIYFCDQAHVPYGNKDPEDLKIILMKRSFPWFIKKWKRLFWLAIQPRAIYWKSARQTSHSIYWHGTGFKTSAWNKGGWKDLSFSYPNYFWTE